MTINKIIARDEYVVAAGIQKAIDEGKFDALEKWQINKQIEMRANETRVAGETDAQAFARTITKDAAGQLLYKAMRVAPGSEVRPEPAPARQSGAEVAKHLG